MSVVLSGNMTKELSNPSSIEFKRKAAKLESLLDRALNNSNLEVRVVSFRQGSIIADVEITSKAGDAIKPSDMEGAIKYAIKNDPDFSEIANPMQKIEVQGMPVSFLLFLFFIKIFL